MSTVIQITDIFGPAPSGINLKEENYTLYNSISCVFYTLAVFSVILRYFVRITRGGGTQIDDHTIILGVVCTASTLFTTLYIAKFGSGQHVWALSSVNEILSAVKIVYVEPFVYAAAVTSTKASVILLYRRLFDVKDNTDLGFSIMMWISIFLTSTYPFILWITMLCACRPISYYWEQYVGAKGSCINTNLFYLVLGIVNMINDVIILTVPVPKILRLKMEMKKKISVVGIFLLGSFVCVASIFRIYYLNRLAHAIDATWWFGPGMAWSCIEPSCAIISACLPTYAPLFRGRGRQGTGYKQYGSSGAGHSGSRTLDAGHQSAALSSRSRGKAWVQVNDDEIELTGSGRSTISKVDDGIVVSHRFDVSSESQSHYSGK